MGGISLVLSGSARSRMGSSGAATRLQPGSGTVPNAARNSGLLASRSGRCSVGREEAGLQRNAGHVRRPTRWCRVGIDGWYGRTSSRRVPIRWVLMHTQTEQQ